MLKKKLKIVQKCLDSEIAHREEFKRQFSEIEKFV